MGKEADVYAEVGDAAGEVRALLERDELILRGDIRRRFPRASLRDVTIADGVLSFTGGGQPARGAGPSPRRHPACARSSAWTGAREPCSTATATTPTSPPRSTAR